MKFLDRARGRAASAGRDTDPRPPLPVEPLYVSEYRGDGLPPPPFSADPDDLDEPPRPRPPETPPSLDVGSVIQERPTMTRAWRLHREPFDTPYPSRTYAVRDVRGLRWERFNGRGMWVLHYDEGVVAGELPAWFAFGPRGQQVADILEQVAALERDRVERLAVPTGLGKFSIGVDLLGEPGGGPIRDPARRASSTAMGWVENRAWAIDPHAGGHYYHGCYFVYQLHEPNWLSAMGRAMNAAMAAVFGPDLPGPEAARVGREWSELIG